LDTLRERGAVVAGISGDFRLDAFALRISEYQGRPEETQALISLALSKPERDCDSPNSAPRSPVFPDRTL